jgi:hypothetical protein
MRWVSRLRPDSRKFVLGVFGDRSKQQAILLVALRAPFKVEEGGQTASHRRARTRDDWYPGSAAPRGCGCDRSSGDAQDAG